VFKGITKSFFFFWLIIAWFLLVIVLRLLLLEMLPQTVDFSGVRRS
jgi:hypothetical protein